MFSQRFIQDASYLKIANIVLGYSLPDRWFGGYIKGLRIYAEGQNLATLSKYKGYNVDFAEVHSLRVTTMRRIQLHEP